MEHRGKKIRERIEEFGVSKAFIYKKLKIDKKTFDRLLETHNPPDEMIERIGNIIRHDFTIDFPGMNKTVFEHDKTVSAVAEPMIQLPQSVIKKLLSMWKKLKTNFLTPINKNPDTNPQKTLIL